MQQANPDSQAMQGTWRWRALPGAEVQKAGSKQRLVRRTRGWLQQARAVQGFVPLPWRWPALWRYWLPKVCPNPRLLQGPRKAFYRGSYEGRISVYGQLSVQVRHPAHRGRSRTANHIISKEENAVVCHQPRSGSTGVYSSKIFQHRRKSCNLQTTIICFSC
ncbi:hypothetical protein JG688_00015880 [Phytophthora aleatoria]|uniref:Uncharacterized protein n=1 Tax=Phytophthora aleatoria TaxID=2496075 RepID=A0A8J5IYX8_9STRA|nr:hypothetical protein JG688_00015880 [Phytophthora aleatoria]